MCNDIYHARTCEMSVCLMKFFEQSDQLECFREYFNLGDQKLTNIGSCGGGKTDIIALALSTHQCTAYLPATGKTFGIFSCCAFWRWQQNVQDTDKHSFTVLFLNLAQKKLQGILKLKVTRGSTFSPCEKSKRRQEFLVSYCRHISIFLSKTEVLVQQKILLL